MKDKKYIKYMFFSIILTLIIGMVGCTHAGITYKSMSDEDTCVLDCTNQLQTYWCSNGQPLYTNYCRCMMFDCIWKVPVDKRPNDFLEFNSHTISSVSESSYCFMNGILINCSEVLP